MAVEILSQPPLRLGVCIRSGGNHLLKADITVEPAVAAGAENLFHEILMDSDRNSRLKCLARDASVEGVGGRRSTEDQR